MNREYTFPWHDKQHLQRASDYIALAGEKLGASLCHQERSEMPILTTPTQPQILASDKKEKEKGGASTEKEEIKFSPCLKMTRSSAEKIQKNLQKNLKTND